MEDFCPLQNLAIVESDYAVLTGKKTVVAMTTCKDITKNEGKTPCLSSVL